MRREDVLDLIQRIPAVDLPKVVAVMKDGSAISIDIVFRTEPEYLVIRGRENGTNDDNRAFFIPYPEISYLRLERVVKLSDLRQMYGMPVGADTEGAAPKETAEATTPAPTQTNTPPPTPSPAGALDPASIAKQNLLDRIRAARTSVTTARK